MLKQNLIRKKLFLCKHCVTIRIYEDSLFKRTEEQSKLWFPVRQKLFCLTETAPFRKGGNICSQVAISEEKKYKSQNQTDGEDECDKNGQEAEDAEKIIIFQILSG